MDRLRAFRYFVMLAQTLNFSETANHLVPAAGLEPARPTKPRDFKSLVSTIPPRGHVLGGANIAIVDAV